MDDQQICTAFGLKVQAVRQGKGWSQEKLALECCLDRTYISSLERGKRNVSLINIFKIAKALNIPASNLLQLDGENDEWN